LPTRKRIEPALSSGSASSFWNTFPLSARERFANAEADFPCGAPGFTWAAVSFRMVAAVDESGSGPGRKRSSVRISRRVVAASTFCSGTMNSTSAVIVCCTMLGPAPNAFSSHCRRIREKPAASADARFSRSRLETRVTAFTRAR
jgi:hypothetical protein